MDNELWKDAEIISTYTRTQAIEDGALVDVSGVACDAGFRFPVALTRAVWSQCVEVPEGVQCQDEGGRLWDILWMLRYAIRKQEASNPLLFSLHVRNNNRPGTPPLVTLKSICGPGDNGEPVVTVMLPEED